MDCGVVQLAFVYLGFGNTLINGFVCVYEQVVEYYAYLGLYSGIPQHTPFARKRFFPFAFFNLVYHHLKLSDSDFITFFKFVDGGGVGYLNTIGA